MKARPTPVTVIAWLLIGLSALLMILGLLNLGRSSSLDILRGHAGSIPTQYAMLYGGSMINIIAGLGMLTGTRWSRPLYLGVSVFLIAINLMTPEQLPRMMFAVVRCLIAGYYLYRPDANAFFERGSSEEMIE